VKEIQILGGDLTYKNITIRMASFFDRNHQKIETQTWRWKQALFRCGFFFPFDLVCGTIARNFVSTAFGGAKGGSLKLSLARTGDFREHCQPLPADDISKNDSITLWKKSPKMYSAQPILVSK
jgi:hypothetical protein